VRLECHATGGMGTTSTNPNLATFCPETEGKNGEGKNRGETTACTQTQRRSMQHTFFGMKKVRKVKVTVIEKRSRERVIECKMPEHSQRREKT